MFKALLFLALYLPFQLAINPAMGVDLASVRVLILVLFLVWMAQSLKNKRVMIKNNLQTWLVASFLFLNIFSIIAAKNIDWSIRKLVFLLSIFPIYFTATSVFDNQGKIVKIVKVLVASGMLVATVGVLQFFTQFMIGLEEIYKFWAEHIIVPFLGVSFSQAVLQNPSWLVNIAGKTYLRATATFPDPHMLSFYLGILIPLALGIVFLEKNKKALWFGMFSVLLVADLLTFSRGGYLGLFLGAVVLIACLWNKLGKKYKVISLIAASAVASVLLFPSPISQRFYSSFNFKEGSNMGRIATWQQALNVVEKNPIIGVGLGNYSSAIKPAADYREPIYAHNTYLDIAAETGILNAFIWASLLLVVSLEFYKKGRKNILFLMCGISVIIFAAHSAVETAIYSPVVLTLFLILISFSNVEDEKTN